MGILIDFLTTKKGRSYEEFICRRVGCVGCCMGWHGVWRKPIADVQVQRCASLTTNGVEVFPGVYGSSASGAPNPLEAFFSGKGQLRVGEIGMYILIR